MKRALGLVASISLVAVLLWKAGLLTILEVLRNSNPGWLVVAISLYLANYLCRALRFRSLLRLDRGEFSRLWQIVCWHNLWNHLLPARTGELSFVYLARQRGLVSVPSSLSALLVARIFDLTVVLSFFSLGLIFWRLDAAGEQQLLLWFSILFVIAMLLAALWRFSGILTWLASKTRRVALAMRAERMSEILHETAKEFQRMQSSGTYAKTFQWSLFLWLLQFLVFYSLMMSFGLTLSIWQVVIGSTGAALGTLIPTFTGNFGPVEAGWALGFAMVGVEPKLALATGFAMHVLILGFAAVFAFSTLLLPFWGQRVRSKPVDFLDAGKKTPLKRTLR